MTYKQMTIFLVLYTIISLIGNWVCLGGIGIAMNQGAAASAAVFQSAIPGFLVLLAIIAVGLLIAHIIPWKGLPAVAYIVTLGCIVTIPGVPGAEEITEMVSHVNFLGLCTPILAYAGLAAGKDFELMKKQGWRIVLVGLFVLTGTFVGSAVIAELIIRNFLH